MSGIEGHNGYYLKKTGDRVNELLSRQFIVPTLNEEPNIDTVSWQDGDYVVGFRIGELCRVRQGDEWRFFRLQDINDSGYIWVNANASDIPDMEGYYSKEETDELLEKKANLDDVPNVENYYTKQETEDVINDRISTIVVPEDESIKTLSISEYDALVDEGKISDKTLYMVTSEGSPVAVYVGHVLIAQRDEGSQGFAYNFPIIF